MNIHELTQLEELRKALRAITAQLNSASITLNLLKTKVDEVYYDVCREFNKDGGMNKKASAILRRKCVPYSMHLPVPDRGYAIEKMGDLAATTMV